MNTQKNSRCWKVQSELIKANHIDAPGGEDEDDKSAALWPNVGLARDAAMKQTKFPINSRKSRYLKVNQIKISGAKDARSIGR
jgi:hypothetical protein